MTPTMSCHARERCAEMGISTKVAKRIVQHADMVHPGNVGTGCLVARSDAYPDYIVVFSPTEPPTVVTVAFRTDIEYVRNGTTYVPVEEAS